MDYNSCILLLNIGFVVLRICCNVHLLLPEQLIGSIHLLSHHWFLPWMLRKRTLSTLTQVLMHICVGALSATATEGRRLVDKLGLLAGIVLGEDFVEDVRVVEVDKVAAFETT